MAKNLVIVESPAKKKIIQGILGKDFVVESSIGHIRDLNKKGGKVEYLNPTPTVDVIIEREDKIILINSDIVI